MSCQIITTKGEKLKNETSISWTLQTTQNVPMAKSQNWQETCTGINLDANFKAEATKEQLPL